MNDRSQTVFRQRRSRARDWVRRSWNPGQGEGSDQAQPDENAVVHCGWGRLLFGHSFETAEALTEAARGREETRGSHWRDDFPERDDVTWAGHFDTVMSDGVAEVSFVAAPATDGGPG